MHEFFEFIENVYTFDNFVVACIIAGVLILASFTAGIFDEIHTHRKILSCLDKSVSEKSDLCKKLMSVSRRQAAKYVSRRDDKYEEESQQIYDSYMELIFRQDDGKFYFRKDFCNWVTANYSEEDVQVFGQVAARYKRYCDLVEQQRINISSQTELELRKRLSSTIRDVQSKKFADMSTGTHNTSQIA